MTIEQDLRLLQERYLRSLDEKALLIAELEDSKITIEVLQGEVAGLEADLVAAKTVAYSGRLDSYRDQYYSVPGGNRSSLKDLMKLLEPKWHFDFDAAPKWDSGDWLDPSPPVQLDLEAPIRYSEYQKQTLGEWFKAVDPTKTAPDPVTPLKAAPKPPLRGTTYAEQERLHNDWNARRRTRRHAR